MGYCGAVPSEDSSGKRTRRGGITKTGNAHLRRIVVEAAWSYRRPPGIWYGSAQTTGEHLGRGQGDCVEGATPAAQALYEAGCGRQGPEEDCHSSSPRTAGLYLGYWNQSRDCLQAASLQPDTAKSKTFLKKEKIRTPSMNADIHLEHRAGSSQGKHEGEPSLGLCDRLNLTRDNSQRQLPTDHDYAVPTREYQTDQSSLKTAPTAARSVFGKGKQKAKKSNDNAKTTPPIAVPTFPQSPDCSCHNPSKPHRSLLQKDSPSRVLFHCRVPSAQAGGHPPL
jgi:hypothetical protein